jgi:hypothetical protein
MHWRTHPKLVGRFHQEHPDDLQVIVHDGSTRLTDKVPELVWVTVTGGEGDVFSGRVLNPPAHLSTVQQGQEIQFIVPDRCPHPLLVTAKYLRERRSWKIEPCNHCGFAELFDAPSDLIRVAFPNVPEGAVMEGFTSFCPLCRGIQMLRYNGAGGESGKPWWQFWKRRV